MIRRLRLWWLRRRVDALRREAVRCIRIAHALSPDAGGVHWADIQSDLARGRYAQAMQRLVDVEGRS